MLGITPSRLVRDVIERSVGVTAGEARLYQLTRTWVGSVHRSTAAAGRDVREACRIGGRTDVGSCAPLDPGFVVALVNHADPDHERCAEVWRELRAPLLSVDGVLVAAAHRLRGHPVARQESSDGFSAPARS